VDDASSKVLNKLPWKAIVLGQFSKAASEWTAILQRFESKPLSEDSLAPPLARGTCEP
jgi:hypothetical protein